MNQTITPLHERFPDWYTNLSSEQQMFIRKTLISLYNSDVAEMLSQSLFLRDRENLEPGQAGQLMEYIEQFVEEGTLHDAIGEYLVETIHHDESIQTFSDILVKLMEIVEPTDGSTSEYAQQASEYEGKTISEWQKGVFAEIGSDLAEVFGSDATDIAREVQQKRALRRAEDLESNINQGATIDFGHQNLH